MRWILQTDGGSRGNPGPSAWGAVLYQVEGDDKSELLGLNGFLGQQTNNFAEYTGLINGLEMLQKELDSAVIKPESIEILMDSQLVVEQVAGRWRTKDVGLKPLCAKAQSLLRGLSIKNNLKYVPRAQNSRADELVNLSLDEMKS